jgi:bacterial/archaeal transporter family-2 protein
MLGLVISLALTVASGVGLIVQQVLNADLRVSLGSAAWAGFVSYLGGTLCMLVLVFILRDGLPATSAIAKSNWYSWTGGLFGAVYIAMGIYFVQRLGAATFISFLVAGQMLGSIVLDHYGWLGMQQHDASPTRLIGAALLVGGVALIRL